MNYIMRIKSFFKGKLAIKSIKYKIFIILINKHYNCMSQERVNKINITKCLIISIKIQYFEMKLLVKY